jgi:peptidoglycan hydrolase-like protein with peptidoglycan-binding domain
MGILDKVTAQLGRTVKEAVPELAPAVTQLQELKLDLDVPGLKDDFKPAPKAKPAYVAAPAYEQVSQGTAVLARGQKGPAVTQLAGQLEQLGYDCGTPKDKFGPKTHASVVEFQKSQSLAPTGVVDQKTLHALETAVNKRGL